MFPCIGPGAICFGISVLVIGNGVPIISRQQIAPGGIVGIGDRRSCSGSQIPGGISILRLAENIARIIVSPNPGLARRLVILPDQLIGKGADFFLRGDSGVLSPLLDCV